MSDTYEINDRNEVIPYTSGRKCTDTRSWRDATELELQQRDEIANLEQQSNQNRKLYETECKDHAFMRKTLERVISERDKYRNALEDIYTGHVLRGAVQEKIEEALKFNAENKEL